MTAQPTSRSSKTQRDREHAKLLKAALARPGVREVMRVYGRWQERDQGLNAYRSATDSVWSIPATNSSNSS